MLLPTALPNARCVCPSPIARRFTASSGTEVPKATSSRPAVNGRMPKCWASPEAPLTIESPPSANASNPSANNPSASTMSPAPPPGLPGFYGTRKLRCRPAQHCW